MGGPVDTQSGWGRRLKRAVKTGSFSGEADGLAASWLSCAVGEARRRTPEIVALQPKRSWQRRATMDDGPADPELHQLGMDFYRSVRDDDVTLAVNIYASIQARLIQLQLGAA